MSQNAAPASCFIMLYIEILLKGRFILINNAILDNTIISQTTLIKFVMLNIMLSVYVFISID